MSQDQYDIFALMAPEEAEEFKLKPKIIGTTLSEVQHAREKKGLAGEYKEGWEEAVGKGNSVKPVSTTTPSTYKPTTKQSVNSDKTAEYLSYKKYFCYAGHQIFIEDPSLTMEEIRKRMVKTFPELSRDRTEMTYTPPVLPKKKGKKNATKTEEQAPLDFQEMKVDEDVSAEIDESIDKPEGVDEAGVRGCDCEEDDVEETVEASEKNVKEEKLVLLPSVVDGEERFGMVVPILKGAKKGVAFREDDLERTFSSWVELLERPTVRNLLVASDGMYEVRITPVAIFVARLTNEETIGADHIEEGVCLRLPPIPLDLFLVIRDFFVRFASLEKPMECLARIYYDGQNYFAYVPHQVVSQTRIQVLDHPEDLACAANNTLVMEVHSHNVLDSKFSVIDDQDELATGIYCIWGNLDQLEEKKASLSCRYSCGGNYRKVNIMELVKNDPLVGRHLPDEQELDQWIGRVLIKGGEFID